MLPLTIMTVLMRIVTPETRSEFPFGNRNFCKFNLESTRGHFFFLFSFLWS